MDKGLNGIAERMHTHPPKVQANHYTTAALRGLTMYVRFLRWSIARSQRRQRRRETRQMMRDARKAGA